MRVPAEDRRQVQTQIDGRLYTARGGFFDMPDRDAKVHLKSAGYGHWGIAGAVKPSTGFRCAACNFGSFFKRCGKCGAECVREGADARSAA